MFLWIHQNKYFSLPKKYCLQCQSDEENEAWLSVFKYCMRNSSTAEIDDFLDHHKVPITYSDKCILACVLESSGYVRTIFINQKVYMNQCYLCLFSIK